METRYEFGMKMLNKVDGHVGEEVVAPLGDLGKILVEVFGDIYGREALSLREREICDDCDADRTWQREAAKGAYSCRIKRRPHPPGN